jgi:hypothetical protein
MSARVYLEIHGKKKSALNIEALYQYQSRIEEIKEMH